MAHRFKIVLPDGELRRFTLAPPAYAALANQVRSFLGPAEIPLCIRFTWTDDEGDVITVATDSDLEEAIIAANGDVVRLNVVVIPQPAAPTPTPMDAAPAPAQQEPQPQPQEEPQFDDRGRIRHPHVVCDGCERPLFGVRYKCAECWNTDFCEDCEAKNVHGDEHVLLKVKKPMRIDLYNSFRHEFGSWYHCHYGGGRNGGGHCHGWQKRHDAASAARWAVHCANRLSAASPSSFPAQQEQQVQDQLAQELKDMFGEQLAILRDMGFLNDMLSIDLLLERNGAVAAVIDQLISLSL